MVKIEGSQTGAVGCIASAALTAYDVQYGLILFMVSVGIGLYGLYAKKQTVAKTETTKAKKPMLVRN